MTDQSVEDVSTAETLILITCPRLRLDLVFGLPLLAFGLKEALLGSGCRRFCRCYHSGDDDDDARKTKQLHLLLVTLFEPRPRRGRLSQPESSAPSLLSSFLFPTVPRPKPPPSLTVGSSFLMIGLASTPTALALVLVIEWFSLGVGFPSCSFFSSFASAFSFSSHVWQRLRRPRLGV